MGWKSLFRKKNRKRDRPNRERPNPNSLTIGGVDLSLGPDRELNIGNQAQSETPMLDQAEQMGPGLGGLGGARGLGFAEKGKRTGNELRRGTGVIEGGPAREAANGDASAHATWWAEYDEEIGLSGSNRAVYKANPEIEEADASQQYNIGQHRGDSRMAARAVASGRLDRALGTNVLAEDTFSVRGDEVGLLSPQVEGQALGGAGYDKTMLGVDLGNETFKKTLCDLELLDYLCGQVDRHQGNIFVGPDGAVIGIDNDMAFGTEDTLAAQGNREAGNHIKRLPKFVDVDTARKVLEMDESQFLAAIGGRSSDPERLRGGELDAAVGRFYRLRNHLLQLESEGALIDDWSQIQGSTDNWHAGKGEGSGWESYLDRTDGFMNEQYKNAELVEHDTRPKKKKGRAGLFA